MARIGFIGLGNLGRTIALHLKAEGVDLMVWNRTGTRTEGIGLPVAATPAELADGSETIIINVFDSTAVSDVLTGPKGIFTTDCRGKIIIDTSTNHPMQVGAFHDLARQQGAHYLECPLLGSVGPASQGALTVLVSGEQETYQQVLPLLQKIGSTVFWMDAPGQATRMKLINNLVLGSFMATCAEAVALSESAGIAREEAIRILLAGAGNSMVLTAKKQKLADLEFSAQFSSALIYKDLHYLQDLCRELRRPLVTGSMVKEMYAIARSKGIENEDFSSIYRIFRDL